MRTFTDALWLLLAVGILSVLVVQATTLPTTLTLTLAP